jgi:hypothetical protein
MLSWQPIEQALRMSGCQQLRASNEQHIAIYEYLAVKDAWIPDKATPYSLCLRFKVDLPSNATTQQRLVRTASAYIEGMPNVRYSVALNQDWYSQGSVIYRSLRLANVSDAAADYPFLHKVEVEYSYISDPYAESVEQGFCVSLTLSSTIDATRGIIITHVVPSGLDAPVTWDGRAIDNHYQPRDSLGAFRFIGSSGW